MKKLTTFFIESGLTESHQNRIRVWLNKNKHKHGQKAKKIGKNWVVDNDYLQEITMITRLGNYQHPKGWKTIPELVRDHALGPTTELPDGRIRIDEPNAAVKWLQQSNRRWVGHRENIKGRVYIDPAHAARRINQWSRLRKNKNQT